MQIGKSFAYVEIVLLMAGYKSYISIYFQFASIQCHPAAFFESWLNWLEKWCAWLIQIAEHMYPNFLISTIELKLILGDQRKYHKINNASLFFLWTSFKTYYYQRKAARTETKRQLARMDVQG